MRNLPINILMTRSELSIATMFSAEFVHPVGFLKQSFRRLQRRLQCFRDPYTSPINSHSMHLRMTGRPLCTVACSISRLRSLRSARRYERILSCPTRLVSRRNAMIRSHSFKTVQLLDHLSTNLCQLPYTLVWNPLPYSPLFSQATRTVCNLTQGAGAMLQCHYDTRPLVCQRVSAKAWVASGASWGKLPNTPDEARENGIL